MKIAFLDSGIGGLTVCNTARNLFPNATYIYYADSDNAPYGKKTQEEIKQLVFQAIDFLAQFDIDALVIACHTATRLFLKELQNSFLFDFPIIGMTTGLNPLRASHSDKKTLFCATDITVQVLEKEYRETGHIDGNKKLEFLSLQELVIWAERFQFDRPEVYNYLEKIFSQYDWEEYQTMVLGCTHFPFFKNQIQDLLPAHIHIVDGSESTTMQLLNALPYSGERYPTGFEYYISGKPVSSALQQQVSLFGSSRTLVE